MARIKATCENWALAQICGRQIDAPGAIGRGVVFGNGGQTTAIAAIDAVNRTITTINGSVYALGLPKLMFAVKYPEIMRELGF